MTRPGVVALCEAGAGEIVDPGWSDRRGQLGEGRRYPQRRGFVDSEFVVAAADVLHKRVTLVVNSCSCGEAEVKSAEVAGAGAVSGWPFYQASRRMRFRATAQLSVRGGSWRGRGSGLGGCR